MVRESFDGKDSFEVKVFSLEMLFCRYDISLVFYIVVDEEYINIFEF